MRKNCLMFAGQGSQYKGMAKRICAIYPKAQEIFATASAAIGIDLKSVCIEGDGDILLDTSLTQPAILTTSYAIASHLIDELHIRPSMAVGHSLGEYTALTIAGCLDLTTAVKIVHRRGQLMKEVAMTKPGSMLAVSGIKRQDIDAQVEKFSAKYPEQQLVVSNYNSKSEFVVSGQNQGIELFKELMNAQGHTTIPLKVHAQFHNPVMREAANRLRPFLEAADIRNPNFSVVSTTTGEVLFEREKIIKNLVDQIVKPVLWSQVLIDIYTKNPDIAFIDVGPRSYLKSFLQDLLDESKVDLFSTENDKGYEALRSHFLTEQKHFIASMMRQIATTKNYTDSSLQYDKILTECCLRLSNVYNDVVSGVLLSPEKLGLIRETIMIINHCKKENIGVSV